MVFRQAESTKQTQSHTDVDTHQKRSPLGLKIYVQINFTSYEFNMSGLLFPLTKNVNLAFVFPIQNVYDSKYRTKSVHTRQNPSMTRPLELGYSRALLTVCHIPYTYSRMRAETVLQLLNFIIQDMIVIGIIYMH